MDGGLVHSLLTVMKLPEATIYQGAGGKVAAEDSQGIIAVDVHVYLKNYGDIVNPDAMKIDKEVSRMSVSKKGMLHWACHQVDIMIIK